MMIHTDCPIAAVRSGALAKCLVGEALVTSGCLYPHTPWVVGVKQVIGPLRAHQALPRVPLHRRLSEAQPRDDRKAA